MPFKFNLLSSWHIKLAEILFCLALSLYSPLNAETPGSINIPETDLSGNDLVISLGQQQILCVIVWNHKNKDTVLEFEEAFLNELLVSRHVHFLFLIQDDLPKIRGRKIKKEIIKSIAELNEDRNQLISQAGAQNTTERTFYAAMDSEHKFAISWGLTERVVMPYILLLDHQFQLIHKGKISDFSEMDSSILKQMLTSQSRS